MDIKELYKLYEQHPCITTDSRDCPEGSIFLALKGESFNGNKFALQALEKGCSYAIIDEPDLVDSESDHRSQLIVVDDALQTFKDLAREHRRQFDIPVIGITGTNGKTTTKELIA
ncbi:MAG: UDP-N-acetylmuramoyl-tripeptide--D-alanyl-D-alanine ligase, partial [Prevotella sp.]|nr:UDP-N-acetylmuramoyl-tripeptide--D-alanyl-D-alanine ligase [Prevotella sp.]